MLGGIAGRHRDLIPEGPYGAFEQDMEALFGERLRAGDEALGKEIWSALANLDWAHPVHGEIGYSFRAAGDLIASLCRDGDYMDWYCCGPYAVVSERVGDALAVRGWMPMEEPA